MILKSRHSALLMTALVAAAAAPLAFAQDANASASAQDHAAMQATPPATTGAIPATPATPATRATPPSDTAGDAMAASQATPATPAAPATPASATHVSWSQLDADHDGKLSKSEAASVKSLSKDFDKADANQDGALTTDEYKAYVAARGNGHAHQG